MAACSKNISVIELKDNNTQIKRHGLTYYLPKVCVVAEIQVTTEVFIPGPYNRYADKFLSIKNVQAQRYSLSEISDISFHIYYKADPNAAFMMFNTVKHNFRFSPDMRLLAINTGEVKFDGIDYPQSVNIPDFNYAHWLITDMTAEENFTSILDTTYRVIEIDSVFQKIPVYNAVMTSKTEEQKAEEAAEFIIELRKSRLAIIQGDMDIIPSSGTTKQMLAKIDEMEQKYLELFIGKTFTATNKYYHKYIPTADKNEETEIMFYLCDEFGISKTAGLDKIPVEISFVNHGLTKEYQRFMNIQSEIKEKKKGVFYRIPSNGSIYITADSHTYASISLTVPQNGVIVPIPEKIMKNKNLKIKLHPDYGSLLYIK